MQLASLEWRVQPVTTYDMVHLLLPFMWCKREYRAKLVQYVESITLAQALGASRPHARLCTRCLEPCSCSHWTDMRGTGTAYPLLGYEPSVLAVAAVVCGAHLVVKQTNRNASMDEVLNDGLAGLCGVDPNRTRQCRGEVRRLINLDKLVSMDVDVEAPAELRGNQQRTPHAGRCASEQGAPQPKHRRRK